jgi:hypothetical protein
MSFVCLLAAGSASRRRCRRPTAERLCETSFSEAASQGLNDGLHTSDDHISDDYISDDHISDDYISDDYISSHRKD